MGADKRLDFTKKWHQRGVAADDPFDRFIYLWIALIVAAQRLGGSRRDDTDRLKLLGYLRAKSQGVMRALHANHASLAKLAARRGTDHQNPIVDSGNPHLRQKLTDLVNHYADGWHLSDADLTEAIGELLNRIRNNLFHGAKVYDDRDDMALLELVNPVLLDILRECEGLQ